MAIARLTREHLLKGVLMSPFRVLASSFPVCGGNGELAQYQLLAFAKQLPVLYGILMVNAVALAATHASTAPLVLTLVIPAVLCVACLARVAFWLRGGNADVPRDEAVRRLRATMPLVGLLGVAFTAWSFSLYPYGDAYARCHVAFYMSITVISCIFCLMHLRSAALMLTAIVVVPFTVFFCLTGQPVLIAIAINFQLVSCGMVFILLRNYRDFTTMVVSQRELLARQEEMQRLADENFRLATMDGLTGLPNRRCFLAQLDRVLASAQARGRRFAVALVDLDGFKGVNDVHGHAAGDRLLTEVGERLRRLAAPSVFFSRLGGDEFGAIFEGGALSSPLSDADILSFGQLLRVALYGPYLQPDIVADVSGSVGVVAYPEGGQSAQQLFERADYALYHAKQHKTGEAVMFSCEHETMIRESGRIEQALRLADLSQELWPAFQPIVDGETGRTIGFEALARWTSPELGRVAPDVFIPIAERTQLIGRVTETILAKALAIAATWPRELRLSVNLSAQDISSPRTMAAVRGIVSRSGVSAGRIDLELTESAMMRDFDQAAEALASLRAIGVRISLDDFGTGFSSLSHVHRLQLDKIKIDKSFVRDVNTSQASCDIVKTIADLCRNLGLECIVEGVETEAQRRRLMSLGCRLMQGYLFAKPIDAAALPEHIKQTHAALALVG